MKKILCVLGLLSGFVTALNGQNRFDIVIDEIMADPSPPAGLPNNEWVELKNISGHPINIQGWRLGDASGISGSFPSYLLKADSFLIVCSSGSLAAMQAFGPALSVTSFPSLDNDGEIIFLRSPNGSTIHAVGYSAQWYKNEVKKEGGWSLEMMDTHEPCPGYSNWTASKDNRGGSPGKINSTDSLNRDQTAPSLVKIYSIDSLHILLRFDDPVDSASAVSLSHFQLNRGISISTVVAIPPLFNELRLNLASPLLPFTVYTLKVSGIRDCHNNSIRDTLVSTGLSADPLPGEWVINEILFDPRSGGSDYVEFYNNSEKIFDAARLFLANRTNGVVGSIKALSSEPFFILPGEYLVVTADSHALKQQYRVNNDRAILELSSFPSFPDDEGIVVALKFQGIIAEELCYKADWHFALIRDKEGVALERIDPDGPAQERSNWHSASSSSGYGTPGYQNSQYKNAGSPSSKISLVQKIFSPDNDGYEDLAMVRYTLAEPGYMAQVHIYDMNGQEVRYLVKNQLLGKQGSWTWDGLNEKGQSLPIGHYIILVDLFDLSGRHVREKLLIVLARRFDQY